MKITRAMELIATARIGKAQIRVAQAKPYTEKMNDVIRNIAVATGSLSHPLLERRDVHNVGVLVVTSDRGLAGGYNTSVIRFAERAIQRHQSEGKIVRVYTIGAKAQSYFREAVANTKAAVERGVPARYLSIVKELLRPLDAKNEMESLLPSASGPSRIEHTTLLVDPLDTLSLPF